jgi:hypothetical protein
MDNLYSFVYRGVLTEEALDKVGRNRRRHFGAEEARELQKTLCYDLLEAEALADAQRMSTVYAAIHAFENIVRHLVSTAMAEHHGEGWWSQVPDRIRKSVATRMAEDAKFRWHGARGASELKLLRLRRSVVDYRHQLDRLRGSPRKHGVGEGGAVHPGKIKEHDYARRSPRRGRCRAHWDEHPGLDPAGWMTSG